MDENEFKNRTKKLSLRIIKLVESLPNKISAEIIGKQLLRSATSVGANYRAACRAKSTNFLLSKKKPMKVCIGLNFWKNLN